jgi:transposase
MAKPFRARRDFEGLEGRRKQAARLFSAGRLRQAEIARRLNVSRVSVHRWYQAWLKGGSAALRKAERAGRKARLTRHDLSALDGALRAGAAAWGFSTDLWTLPRVARVIRELTGETYHPGHVWRILRGLNWSRQRPARRAKERDEKAIQKWAAEDWPRVKKTPADSGPGSSSKTKAGSRTARLSARRGRPKGELRS